MVRMEPSPQPSLPDSVLSVNKRCYFFLLFQPGLVVPGQHSKVSNAKRLPQGGNLQLVPTSKIDEPAGWRIRVSERVT